MKKNLQRTNTAKTLDAFDAAMDCQENLAAIAVLLEDSGNHAAADPHERRVLTGAGRLIASEARKMQAALNILETHCQNSPSKSRRNPNPNAK